MPEIDGITVPFIPIGGMQELKRKSDVSAINAGGKPSFKDIFSEELDKLKFSAHAQARLASRDINLTENDMKRLQQAVGKAQQKGAAETLVMLDEKAFIVSVPNNTVITVVDKNRMQSHVITEIDSAVLA